MNDEQQRLSRLITDVYDAALNPSFWVDVAGFVGGIRHLFEDRHSPPGRPGQARRRVFQSAGALIAHPRDLSCIVAGLRRSDVAGRFVCVVYAPVRWVGSCRQFEGATVPRTEHRRGQ